MNDPAEFPRRPLYQAKWRAVYVEPSPHSGERIAIAVAATLGGVDVGVRPLIDEYVLHCMYPDGAQDILGQLELVCEALAAWLKKGRPLETWSPPLTSTFAGDVRLTEADSVSQALDSAAMWTSSLYVAHAANRHADPVEYADARVARRRFSEQVRAVIEQRRGSLLRYFHAGRGGQPSRGDHDFDAVDFLGRRFVCGLLAMDSKNLRKAVSEGQAKAWRLEYLRDSQFSHPGHVYELIVARPPRNTIEFDAKSLETIYTALDTLATQAKQRDLSIRAVDGAIEAADRIVEVESVE
ncbi:MAG: hypothetical protein HYX63_07005 [Gammaproteobacteria bacterium]|nr:hypothetical protein [Gammaproteobacteria bacterium]